MGALQRIYHELKDGDVYLNWSRFMKILCITNEHEGSGKDTKKIVTVNTLAILWYVFSSIRISHHLVWDSGYPHFFGSTEEQMGNTTGLLSSLSAFMIFTALLYRGHCIRLTLSGGMYFMRTVKIMTSGAEVNAAKVAFARKMVATAVIFCYQMFVGGFIMCAGMLYLNIRASSSMIEVICWIAWCLIDLVMCFSACTDVLTFPIMWITIVLSYRMDMIDLMQCITDINDALIAENETMANELFDEIRHRYYELYSESQKIDQFSVTVITIILFWSTPYFCIMMFMFIFTDNIFIYYMCPICAVAVLLLVTFVLVSAATVTHLTEKLTISLLKVAAQDAHLQALNPRQRQQLDLMTEQMSSLAMYTMVGERYTPLSFVHYVVETCVQYSLLITFNKYITLH